jgi:hypothetical protein
VAGARLHGAALPDAGQDEERDEEQSAEQERYASPDAKGLYCAELAPACSPCEAHWSYEQDWSYGPDWSLDSVYDSPACSSYDLPPSNAKDFLPC